MSHQAIIKLRHLPDSSDSTVIEPAIRSIRLTPTRKVLKIGRASKNIDKGFQGAPHNAWFDSPVMSRNHAEITFHPSDNTFHIRDLGSMHGTFLNGEKLPVLVTKPLNNFDKIVFGIGVRSGAKVFSACEFKATYFLESWKKPNIYTVPDSSSDEEESYKCSDHENMSNGGFSDTDTKMACSRPAVSKSIDAIDLTQKDTPSPKPDENGSSPASTIMLRAISQSRSPVLGGASADIPVHSENSHPEKQEIACLENSPGDTSRNDEEDEREIPSSLYDSMESDLDDEMDDASDDDNHEERSVVSGPDNSEASDSSDISEVDSMSISSANRSRSCSPAPSVITSRPPFENVDIPESHVRTRIHTFKNTLVLNKNGSNKKKDEDDDDDDDDDDASVGLSDAANEGFKTLWEGNLLEDKPFNLSIKQNTWNHTTGRVYAHPFASSGISQKNDMAIEPTRPQNFSNPTSSCDRKNFMAPEAPIPLKSASSATAMGEKTGKHAFFEARKNNKLQFQAQSENERIGNDKQSKPSSSSNSNRLPNLPPHLSSLLSPSCVSHSRYLDKMRDPFEEGGRNNRTVGQLALESIVNHQPFEETPPVHQPLEETPSAHQSFGKIPSVHPFYWSVDASSKASESPRLEVPAARSGLRIDDIIDRQPIAKPLKRNADEISEDDHVQDYSSANDVEKWASSVVASFEPRMLPKAVSQAANQESTIRSPEATNQESKTRPPPPLLATANSEIRPVKRPKVKGFAEAAGYFALGGVAVGASLFSALVATAPDFL